MFKNSTHIILFACFSIGLPLWGMHTNKYDGGNAHNCSGDCYAQWVEETGGVVQVATDAAAAKAEASPAELGEMAYAGCVACHGANGEGGIGPAIGGQPAADIAAMLGQYKRGETRGSQSALMWSQAAQLSDKEIENLAIYIESQ